MLFSREPNTYRGIDNAIPLQIRILMQPMMRLAKGNARATARDRTGINWVEATEERRRPLCIARWVRDAGWVFCCGGRAGHPVVDILLHLGFGGGGHCGDGCGRRGG